MESRERRGGKEILEGTFFPMHVWEIRLFV
jgi:hypothetical protein